MKIVGIRKTVVLLLMYFAIGSEMNAQSPDWGKADTIEHYSIGPGATYTRMSFKKKKLDVHQTTIDLNNPYNNVELYPSNKKTPDSKRETTTSQCINNSYEGHRVFCGVNHDLFHYSGQTTAAGINVRNGEIVSHYGNWGRSILSINKAKKAEVFPPNFVASLIFHDGSSISIDNINESAYGIQGVRNCVLFNTFSSLTLSEVGSYVLLEPQSEWLINGEPTACKILTIQNEPIQPDGTKHILFIRNNAAITFLSKAKVGDTVKISQNFIDGRFHNSGIQIPPAQNIVQAAHGWPSVILNGELHDKEYNDFVEAGRENWDYPCTMAGITKDGKKLFILTVDNASLVEDAYFLVAQGAWNVVNFDGGGSTTMVINNKLKNNPKDGSERPVMDSFQGISFAPNDPVMKSITFTRPTISAVPLAKVPLRVLGHNQYGDIINEDIKGLTFTCSPKELGYVNEDGIFCAGKKTMDGIIIAQKEEMQTIINVKMQPSGEIKLTNSNVLIDAQREYAIGIETSVDGAIYQLNPAAFTWTEQDYTGCCIVEDGKLKGVKNGETTLTGSCDELNVLLHVKVEIGKDVLLQDDFMTLTSEDIKASSFIKNIRFEKENLPFGWENGLNLVFDINSGRSPFIEIQKPFTFYGLPDSTSIQLQVKNSLIKEVYFNFSSQKTPNLIKVGLTSFTNKDSIITIPFNTNGVPFDITDFPITLNSIKFYLKAGVAMNNAIFSLRDLKAYYPEKSGVGIENKTCDDNQFGISLDNGVMTARYSIPITTAIQIALWSINGQKIYAQTYDKRQPGNYSESIPIDNLPSGIYIIQIKTDKEKTSIKFVLE